MTMTTSASAASMDHRFAGIYTPSAGHPPAPPGGGDGGGGPAPSVVSPGFETRTLLESIRAVPSVDRVGSDEFMAAYCVNLERLSVQAHWTAGSIALSRSGAVGGGDGAGGALSALAEAGGADGEYVVEAFLEDVGRIEALVRTLLSIEMWRENVLFAGGLGTEAVNPDPAEEEVEFEIGGRERAQNDEAGRFYDELNAVDGGEGSASGESIEAEKRGLANRLAANGNALRAAFVLHAETTIVSILSLIFFRGIPAEFLEGAGGDDVLLSIVDYCARQMVFLASPEESNPALSRQKNPLPVSQLSGYLQRRSRLDEIRDSLHDSMFRTAVASVTLSRYLCENADELGTSLLGRMLEFHDFPLLMILLVEEPPWTRRRAADGKGGKSERMIWEKWNERGEWREVPSADLLRLTQMEGQPWIALFHLTSSKACRESYGLDEFRKSRLMRLRGYIHEALLDQLPVLADVARYLDELSVMGVPPPSGSGAASSSSGLLLRRVDTLWESIVGKRDARDGEYWDRISRRQWEEIFSQVTDSTDPELRRIALEVYDGDAASMATTDRVLAESQTSPLAEDKPLSTSEDWKRAQSKTIKRVTLHLRSGDGFLASFDLVPVQYRSASTTDTPSGPFRRDKLSISQTCGEGDAIHPRAEAVACIEFQNDASPADSSKITLSLDSIALPTMEHSAHVNIHDEVGIALPEPTFPPKVWRQLGDLEDRMVVLQLGFKRVSRGTVPAGSSLLRGYTVSIAFLSQPLE